MAPSSYVPPMGASSSKDEKAARFAAAAEAARGGSGAVVNNRVLPMSGGGSATKAGAPERAILQPIQLMQSPRGSPPPGRQAASQQLASPASSHGSIPVERLDEGGSPGGADGLDHQLEAIASQFMAARPGAGSTMSAFTNSAVPPSSQPAPAVAATSVHWQRGQILGQGSFGRVYFGLNTVTGEVRPHAPLAARSPSTPYAAVLLPRAATPAIAAACYRCRLHDPPSAAVMRCPLAASAATCTAYERPWRPTTPPSLHALLLIAWTPAARFVDRAS